MKKYQIISLLAVLLLMAQCGSKKNSEEPVEKPVPMWVFDSNSTTGEIRDYLESERILGTERTVTIDDAELTVFGSSDYIVEYLGIEWSGYMVGTIDDTIAIVNLMRIGGHGQDLYDASVKALVGKLDDMYGNHRRKNNNDPLDDNTREWDWVCGDVSVRMFATDAVRKNDVMGLEIVNGDKEEMERLISKMPL